MQLRPYQHTFINDISAKFGQGMTRVVAQLATGGGKTVTFAEIVKRYIDRQDMSDAINIAPPGKDVLILVHREELLKQSRNTIYEWHGIVTSPVVPKIKNVEPSRCYVAMAETANNRLKKNPNYFRNVGLVIIDECHLGGFKKLLNFVEGKIVIGFTATPIAATKKDPLKNYYQDIVCGPSIGQLIQMGSLVPCVTYGPRNVNKNDLHIVAGEYDQAEMSAVYSNSKHVQNTVEKYKSHGQGKKALIFNCSIAHSILVYEAFVAAGFPCKHLDSEAETDHRREVLQWFKETPGAILCNIGILTTGFDEPTVECVVINKSTKSKALWNQMNGRGGRTCEAIGKKYFICIDMGDNVTDHLEWSDDFDWAFEFHHPGEPQLKSSGVAAIKICCNESCEGIIPIQARVCKWCGKEQPVPVETFDSKLGEFVLITKNMDVLRMINENKTLMRNDGQPASPYMTLHKIKSEIVLNAKNRLRVRKIDDDTAQRLMSSYQEKVKEWCAQMKKPYNAFHKTATGEWFLKELEDTFHYKPAELSLDI